WHGLLQQSAEAPLNSKPGKLWLRLIAVNEETLQVEIEDNGIGRKRASEIKSKDTLKTKSYGMQIGKERIRIINKQHTIKSFIAIEDLYDDSGNPSGTKVILQLPLIEMAAKLNT